MNLSRVVTCYDILDAAVLGGVTDFTDGKYNGNESLDYEQAQKNQADWILDQLGCSRGKFFLDIGCGYGRIIEAAEARGAKAMGITLSPQQRDRCVRKGLNVAVLNYKNISNDWDNSFHGIIANGSLEHFAQVQDAVEGKQDEIYRNFFDICHRVSKRGARLVTTAIHFNQDVNPSDAIRGSRVFSSESTEAHYARVLLENFGGWYPQRDQLARVAEGFFTLEHREDATRDYHLTSEYWLNDLKKRIKFSPKAWVSLAGKFLKNRQSVLRMLDCLLFSQSWMWQFRPREDGSTPTVLYRDVWGRVN